MTIPIRPERRAEAQPVRGVIRHHDSQLPAEQSSGTRPEPSTAELTFRIFAAFRAHPHISNVLTHIASANWAEVERSLNRILDLATASDGLSLLEQNIIDLMVAERGVTGKILKPHFHAILHRLLEPHRAERLIRHIDVLFRELESKARNQEPGF